jgi:hypothetical protein
MDNFFIHTKPEVLTILREHSVKGIIFPPHTTRRFQALDLIPCGVLQRKLEYQLAPGDDERTFEFIQKAFHSVEQTFLPDNVRNAFEMLRFKLWRNMAVEILLEDLKEFHIPSNCIPSPEISKAHCRMPANRLHLRDHGMQCDYSNFYCVFGKRFACRSRIEARYVGSGQIDSPRDNDDSPK